MQSIDRFMSVIEVLVSDSVENQLSITDLSKSCGIPISSMHRILKAMGKHNLIQQDEKTKMYSLGNIWLEYGLRMYDTMDYISKIRPELERLMHTVGESVYLSKQIGMESLVIERIDNVNNPIRVYDLLGTKTPLHIGAASHAILANMHPMEAQEMIDALLPEQEKQALMKQLATVRTNGYAISHAASTEGISSVATPVRDHFGEIQGALSIGFVNFNLTDNRLDFLVENVLETGKRISSLLGYNGL